jgi:hypothetical protein
VKPRGESRSQDTKKRHPVLLKEKTEAIVVPTDADTVKMKTDL